MQILRKNFEKTRFRSWLFSENISYFNISINKMIEVVVVLLSRLCLNLLDDETGTWWDKNNGGYAEVY